MEEPDFALYVRMLQSLPFVPENEVCDFFLILIARRTPPFPMRFWNMNARVLNHASRTNDCVEGWHNAFQTGVSIPHPSFPKLV